MSNGQGAGAAGSAARRLASLALAVSLCSPGLGCRPRPPADPTGAPPGGAATATPPSGAPTVAALSLDRDWRDEVIYFVMTDRFFDGDPSNNRDVDPTHKGAFHGGDFVGLSSKLDYLSELGVTAIWITPVVDQIDHPVHGAGFPDWAYHGYWADDFEQIERRLGTEDELRDLITQAHARGMRVLIDVVLNHPGYGASVVRDATMVRSTELGTCAETDDDLLKCLLGLPDFRTEDPAVAQQLITWQVGWIRRSGCDGFRVDTVKHVDHDVWRRLRAAAQAVRPGFFLLGEVWGATQHEAYASEYLGDQMDSLVDFGFHGAVEGFLKGRGSVRAFAHFLGQRHAFYPERMVLAHYLDSHDETTLAARFGGDRARMRLAALLQMTTLGIPIVTWGNEVGRLGGSWPANRSDMPWGEAQDQELLAWYRTLIHIRRGHPALRRGGFAALHTGDNGLAFLRSLPGEADAVLVVLHRPPEPEELEEGEEPEPSPGPEVIEIELPQALRGRGPWRDLLGGPATAEAPAGSLRLELPVGTGRVLVPASAP